MNWIYTSDHKPLTYLKGDWDGESSEKVLVEDENGKHHIAFFCSGYMDGSAFECWYDNQGFDLDIEVIRWMSIPD